MRGVLVGIAVGTVVLAGAAALVAGEDEKKPATTADLAWLAGDWVTEDGAFDEHWLAPRGGTMFAVSRLVKDDKTPFCELSAIEDTAEGMIFRIRHYSASLEPWKMDAAGPLTMKLATAKEREVVFEDPKKDFPRRIVYRRDGDKLTARLEGEQGGHPANEEFVFKLAPKK